jgi:hypothetical protein
MGKFEICSFPKLIDALKMSLKAGNVIFPMGNVAVYAALGGKQLALQTVATVIVQYVAVVNPTPLKNCAGLSLISPAQRLGGHDLRCDC